MSEQQEAESETTVTADLFALERRFWLEGPEFYREHLDDEVLMLFPGVGMMKRANAIDGIEQAPRWTRVEIRDSRTLQLGPGTWLLCYHAAAQREDNDDYAALVSSVYVRRGAAWKLIFHQQSPSR